MKLVTLPPRTKFWGWDYKKQEQLRMTGKEWHQYAKRETFKSEHGVDAAWGGGCEVWLDGLDMDKKERRV
jgi:hypothetical protein